MAKSKSKFGTEKNIDFYNKDITLTGSYIYTNKDLYPAFIANQRQSKEVIECIGRNFGGKISVIDIGCGDGKYTIEIFNQSKLKRIVGVDPARQAVIRARKMVPKKYMKLIKFRVDNIYELDFLKKEGNYNIALVKGVLHHLYYPQKAIKNLSRYFEYILVLEPNGYNPILKVIEKTSAYHRQHEEKSYSTKTLNNWFSEEGYQVVEQYVFGTVPYFCPKWIAILLKRSEAFVEKIPVIRVVLCGSSLTLYKRANK